AGRTRYNKVVLTSDTSTRSPPLDSCHSGLGRECLCGRHLRAAQWIVGRGVAPDGVENSCELARQCDGRDSLASSLFDFARPPHHRVLLATAANTPGRLDKHPSQSAWSRFRERQILLSLAARVLARHKSHIRFDLVRRRESLALVERCTEADCRYRSYAWHSHKTRA